MEWELAINSDLVHMGLFSLIYRNIQGVLDIVIPSRDVFCSIKNMETKTTTKKNYIAADLRFADMSDSSLRPVERLHQVVVGG